MTRERPGPGDSPKSNAGPARQYHVPAPGPSASKPGAPQKKPPAGATTPKPAGRPTRAKSGPAPSTQQRQRDPGRKPPPRKRRRKRLRWLLILPALLLVAALFFGVRALSTYNKIDRIDLEDALTPASGSATNYLLVGSDSRAELDPEGTSGVTGSRADTIIVLRITDSGSQMMSIPRDLWVTIANTGESGRINGSYNSGPANLVRTVTANLDVPINHYVEVGFGSFAGLVDALGGVPIYFPNPAFDRESGLNIEQPGVQDLTGEQALAYARSRHFVEVVDGREIKDPTADLGRQQRQQNFLRSALGELGNSKNPLELLSAADSMSSELKVDQGLGMLDMFSLARKLGAASPETVVLPTVNARKGKAAVLMLKEPEAKGVLDGFR